MIPASSNQKIYYQPCPNYESDKESILLYSINTSRKKLNSRAVDVMQSIFETTQSISKKTPQGKFVNVYLQTEITYGSRFVKQYSDENIVVGVPVYVKYISIGYDRINEIAKTILTNYEEAYTKRRWTILKILDRIRTGLGCVTELDRMHALNESINQNVKSIQEAATAHKADST